MTRMMAPNIWANRDSSKYQAFRITEAKPDVGDIVCRDRGENGKCGGTTYDNVSDGAGLTGCGTRDAGE